jgi:ABC-2 type transport system permease protein
MRITFAVFYYNVMYLVRNIKSAGIMFVLPIIFMGIFSMAFGSGSTLVHIKSGIYVESDVQSSAPDVSEILRKADESTTEIEIKSASYPSLSAIEADLRDNKIGIGLLVSKPQNTEIPVKVTIIGNKNNQEYQQARGVLLEILSGALLADTNPISSKVLNPDSGSTSFFNILVPGLIVYGLLILLPGIAQSFTTITEKNYLIRFQNSKAKSRHIIMGSVLYYLLISVIQILLLYYTAVLFGYSATGSIFVAFIPAMLSALFVIGVGLLIGAFVKKTESASNIGSIISVIFGFFSGSFIVGIGSILEFDVFGRTFQFNDFLPSKWGTTALDKVLSQNLGLRDIQLELLVLGISGVIILVLGMVVYQKKQLQIKY